MAVNFLPGMASTPTFTACRSVWRLANHGYAAGLCSSEGPFSCLTRHALSVLSPLQLGNWYTWVTLLVFVIAAAFWTMRLNQGLAMFPVMVISPMLQVG